MTAHAPEQIADVLVVGAGSSGAVFAARISEDPDRSLVLLDEGPDHGGAEGAGPERLADAMSLPSPVTDRGWTRWFDLDLADGRTAALPRGRLVGGSSAVNGAYFIRGTRADFDAWAAAGNTEWSYDRVLPAFRRSERDLDFGDEPWHGLHGPIVVSRPTVESVGAIGAAFVEAAHELGYPAEPDKNAVAEPGVGPVPTNSIDGRRVDVASAYLGPVRGRPNLSVRGGVRVRRVVIEGGRAIGVEYDAGRTSRILRAHQVVLSAGAVGTAELLMHSGVGPAADLIAAGVDVVVDAPGVGRLLNHPGIDLRWRLPAEVAPHVPVRSAFPLAVHVDSGIGPARGADLELLLAVVPYGVATGSDPADELLSLRIAVQRHTTAGRVGLSSATPHVPPWIRHDLLSDPLDRERARRGVRAAVELLGSGPLGGTAEVHDGPSDAELASDRDLDRWILDRVGPAMHVAGTAAMGPDGDPDAVVDQWCRVRGVDGLRVVDTSIMPTLTTRGPAATAVMIGERAAELFVRS